MVTQRPAGNSHADERRADFVRLHEVEDEDSRLEVYQRVYGMLPVSIQRRLLFVRWLVETGWLEP